MRQSARTDPREHAEILAIRSLAFLAGDMERLEPFLSLTGLAASQLRAAAAEPGFLPGILEYLTNNESLLIKCALELSVEPTEFARARDALAGLPPEWGP